MNPTASTSKLATMHNLSPAKALQLAWAGFVLFMGIPFAVTYWFIWNLPSRENGLPDPNTGKWFIASMAYLAVVAGIAFFWREYVFNDYRTGKPVPPAKYLLGTIGVWLALDTAGLFALTGCVITGALLPNLLPAFLALGLFLMLWPTGRAMIQCVGNEKDAELYEGPR